MLGAAQQRLPRQMLAVEGEWLLEDLGRGVVIRGIEREAVHQLAAQCQLPPVSDGLVNIGVLTEKSIEVQDREINLVTKQIVEVVGSELILPVKKGLQDTSFESAVLL